VVYYYVFAKLIVKGKRDRQEWFSESAIQKSRVEEIIAGYNSGKKFLFVGKPISYKETTQISIFRSEKYALEIILPNGKKYADAAVREKLEYFNKREVDKVEYAMDEFNIVPPEQISEDYHPIAGQAKKDVFIVHGRKDRQALLLQKYLREKHGISAKIFEDFKEETGSNTIIELLEYIWKNASYAFIVATSEDIGAFGDQFERLKNKILLGEKKIEVAKVCNLLDNLKTRTRQNIVFEFGLFMGALGKDKVCCLLQTGIAEKPSDIDGVLYTEFKDNVSEKFSEIDAKLKKIGT
jgi:predicted nucleotide-binding protein